jgi:hypothetical protein
LVVGELRGVHGGDFGESQVVLVSSDGGAASWCI